LIYLAARQRATPGYKADKTLNQLLDEIGRTGVLPVLNDEDKYTLDHAKATFNESVEEAKAQIKKKIKATILEANAAHKQELTTTPFVSIPQRQEITVKNTNNLMDKITMATVGVAAISAFRKTFTTSLTETVNSAAVDEISHEARMIGQRADQQLVYKQIVDDSRTSPECRRLHTMDGSGSNPRIYTLAQLQANGSNAGLPRSQWKATIGGTHPNCRCLLREATEAMIEENRKNR